MILTLVMLSLLILALTVLFLVVSEFVAFLRTRVPFVPTHSTDIEFIVKKLDIKSNQVFYDLGSGNGKVCFLVNNLTGAECLGFELGWWTCIFAKIKSKFAKGNVNFKMQNFFSGNWSKADYIYAYLYPPLMARIEQKFLQECKQGSVAIIRDFPFPNLGYSEKYFLPKDHEIYVYKK